MKETRITMGMPITIEIADSGANAASFEAVFNYFVEVDARFSTYKEDSEISRINRGEIAPEDYSPEMKEVFAIAKKTKKETNGYFDIRQPDGHLDPSGVVKGWAIQNAASLLTSLGHTDFMVDGSGDIAVSGKNADGGEWSVGIRSPFNREEIVKVVYLHGKGIATSGSSERGAHIYNPLAPDTKLDEIVSISVIAPYVLTADLYATTAFAMGRDGIAFIQEQEGLEGYAIDKNGIATMTTGFPAHTTL